MTRFVVISKHFVMIDLFLGAHVGVQVKPPLRIDRNTLPCALNGVIIQISIDNSLFILRFYQDFRSWVGYQTVTPCVVSGIHIARWATQPHI